MVARNRFHPMVVNFLRDVLKGSSERVGITDYVLVELYNHLRNAAVMRRPIS
jgi:hypothetical protein